MQSMDILHPSSMHLPQWRIPQIQMPDWCLPVFAGAIAIWIFWSSLQHFQKGEAILPRGGGTFYRDKQPILFWLATGLNFFNVAVLTFGAVVLGQIAIQKNLLADCKPSGSGTAAYYIALAEKCDGPLNSFWTNSEDTKRILYENRAFARYRAGESRAAIKDLSKVIAMNPQDEWAYYTRGLANDELGRQKEALSDFDMALRLKPSDWAAMQQRASVNLELQEASKAISDLNRLMAARPNDATVTRMMSLAKEMTGDCATAMPLADRAQGLGDVSMWPYRIKGACYEREHHLDDALRAYSDAIRLTPAEPQNYLDRSNINFRMKNYDLAIADLSAALQENPSDPALLYQRCWFVA